MIAACDGARRRPRIVEGLRHDEALEHYRDADIVVDQLNAGWYGLFAIECMALGKPVVTFLHDEAVRRTEEAFGVPRADRATPRPGRCASGSRSSSRSAPPAATRSAPRRARTSSRCTTSSGSPTASSTSTLAVLEPSRVRERVRPPRPRRPPRPGRRCRSGTPTSTPRFPHGPRRLRGPQAMPAGLGASSAGSDGTRRSTASAASSRASSPCSCCPLYTRYLSTDRLRADRDARSR